MREADAIIQEARNIYMPNAGVFALAKKAEVDQDFCIMDGPNIKHRRRCSDKEECRNPKHMLACLQSRLPVMLGQAAIHIYENGCA